MDETSGTVAHDSSGQGHDGTVNGTADRGKDDGLGFNGSNTYVKVPNNIVAGLNSIGFGNSSGTNGNGYLFSTGNEFRTGVSMADYHTEQRIRPSDTTYRLARGMGKHVTYTQTGNTGVLYENGVEKARNTNVTITPGAIGGGTTTADYFGRSLYSTTPMSGLSSSSPRTAPGTSTTCPSRPGGPPSTAKPRPTGPRPPRRRAPTSPLPGSPRSRTRSCGRSRRTATPPPTAWPSITTAGVTGWSWRPTPRPQSPIPCSAPTPDKVQIKTVTDPTPADPAGSIGDVA
ncbi:hypothetical protein ACWCQQ_18740 [Streptomyces sp. NPDC002143]